MIRHLLRLVLLVAFALGLPAGLFAQHHGGGGHGGGHASGFHPSGGGMHMGSTARFSSVPSTSFHPGTVRTITPGGATIHTFSPNSAANVRTAIIISPHSNFNGRAYNLGGWINSWHNGRYSGYRRGWYDGWYPWIAGYWSWPGTYPYGYGWYGGAGGTLGWANPYWPGTGYDYSQPIPLPEGGLPTEPLNPYSPTPTPPTVPQEVLQDFDAARDAFKQGAYDKALELNSKAVAKLPSDATLHEFRALTLFAQKNYREAAGGLYAVLSAGPGWNWATVWSLYPDARTYTDQLRALETFVRANPDDAAAHFVLAYHYLMTGYNDSAIRQLEQAVKLNPKDQVSPNLLKSLKKTDKSPDQP
jgi:hypothetical protein